MTTISDLGFELVQHPPYSPELALSDFWLFGQMKEPLRGHQYSSIQVLASAINQWVKRTPKNSLLLELRSFQRDGKSV